MSVALGARLADRALAVLPLRWNLRNPSRSSFLARSLSACLPQEDIDDDNMRGTHGPRRCGAQVSVLLSPSPFPRRDRSR